MSCARRIYLYFCLVFIVEVYCVPVNEYEGSKCKNSDSTGICTLQTNCAVAVESLQKYRTHNLHRCGFQGIIEIVCCPKNSPREPATTIEVSTEPPVVKANSNTTSTRGTVRRCIQACEDLAKQIKPGVTYLIINGEGARVGEFPHMAALGYEIDDGSMDWRCGAALITKRFLITAAHCKYPADGIQPSLVRMGVIFLAQSKIPPQDFKILSFTEHPKYQYKEKINDIGIIKIDQDVTFTENVHPACLYTENNDPLGLVATGWGATRRDGTDKSNKLLKATFDPVPLSQCSQQYQQRIFKEILSTQICAVGNNINNSDTCGGDSGGPLQVQNKRGSSVYSIVGLTSYGINCGGKTPGIYTRVAMYLDWIEEIVWR